MATELPDGIILEIIGPDDLKDITPLAIDEFVKDEPPVNIFESRLSNGVTTVLKHPEPK